MGCPDLAIAERSDGLIALVVGKDEKDVGFFSCGNSLPDRESRQYEYKEGFHREGKLRSR